MRRAFPWLFSASVLFIGGVLAVLDPLSAILTAEQIAAWVFLVSGAAQIWIGFRPQPLVWRVPSIILGALGFFVGVSLLSKQLESIVALTLLVAMFFVLSGVAKLVLAFVLAKGMSFWLVGLSGLVSIGLGGAVLSGYPTSAAVILGTLLSIDLIASGIALFAFGWSLRTP